MNSRSFCSRLSALRQHSLAALLLPVTAFLCGPLSAAPSVPSAQHPFQVNDLLKLASVGNGQALGKQIIWEQAPPYDEIGYYGLGHIGAWSETGKQLRTFTWMGDKAVSQPLFTPEPGTSYWLGSVSPDARFAAFYAAKRGSFFVGSFDTQENRVVKFEVAPALVRSWETIWVSADELVFPGTAEGRQPLSAARAYTGLRRGEAWARTWSGGVSVHVAESAAPESDAQWLPGRLYRANVRTGALQVLAEGAYASLALSADRRYLAALHEGPPGNIPLGDWVWSRTQLVVFDLRDGGAPTVIAAGEEVAKGTLTWASDSNELAFFAWRAGESVRTGGFQSWNAVTGTLKSHSHSGLDLASTRERGWMQLPEQPVWFDGRLAVCARAHGGREAIFTYRDISSPGVPGYPGKPDWFLLSDESPPLNLTASFKDVSAYPVHADAHSLTVLADGAVWRLGAKSAAVNLTPNLSEPLTWPRATIAARFNQRGKFPTTAVFELLGSTQPGFVMLDLVTGKAASIASRTGDSALAVSIEGGAVLFRANNATSSDLIVKTSDGRETVLERLNTHLANVMQTKWQTISYPVKTPKGDRTVRGRLLLPPDYQPWRRYPAIVEVYPGTSNKSSDAEYETWYGLGRGPSSWSEHLLAAKGYVVFFPNTATDYIRTDEGPINGMTNMVEQGIDALVGQGYADSARVGLIGVSQGGFSSLWVATQSTRFKAVVSLNGWADMYSHYFESHFLSEFALDVDFRGSAVRYQSKTGGDFNIGKSPYEAPEAYVKNSPLFQAEKVTAPTMLIHSDMDTFAMSHYERFFTALTLLNKRAQLIRYWGEGHTPSSPGNIRDMNSRIFAWFDDYCDVARDAQGSVLWDGDRVQSRKGEPALTPEAYLQFELNFPPAKRQ